MKTRNVIAVVFINITILGWAQTDIDALRYAAPYPIGGTARVMGVSGAFGALGADFTSISINPAGLGLYRSSEFMLTPSLASIRNTASYLGQSYADYRYNFNFTNAGLVIAGLRRDRKGNPVEEGWLAVNFAIGLNRTANFNRQVFFSGHNHSSSLLDRYVQDANGTMPSQLYNTHPFGAGLAWETFLLDTIPGDTLRYYSVIPAGNIIQKKNISSRGGITEWALGIGANYSNKLYVGATVGFPYLRYKESVLYSETDEAQNIPHFQSFALNEEVTTTGQGVNLRVGLLYRIADWLRFGGSLQTPTYYYLEDNYYSSITARFDTATYDSESPDGKYKYDFYTPWKAITSLAVLLGQYGFVSVDYEFTDVSLAYYQFGSGSPSAKLLAGEINNAIQEKYGPVQQLRFGAELRYDKYYLRGGYAISTSPFKASRNDVGADYSRRGFSAGLGFREKEYFLDFAYLRSMTEDYHLPYTLVGKKTEGAVNKTVMNHFVVSIGFRF